MQCCDNLVDEERGVTRRGKAAVVDRLLVDPEDEAPVPVVPQHVRGEAEVRAAGLVLAVEVVGRRPDREEERPVERRVIRLDEQHVVSGRNLRDYQTEQAPQQYLEPHDR